MPGRHQNMSLVQAKTHTLETLLERRDWELVHEDLPEKEKVAESVSTVGETAVAEAGILCKIGLAQQVNS